MRYFVEYKRGAFRFVAGYPTCAERDAKAAELVMMDVQGGSVVTYSRPALH